MCVVRFITLRYHVSMAKICDIFCTDDVTHVRNAIMDMMADESYHLPSEANQICLSLAKAVSEELQSQSQDSVAFCTWLVTQLQQIENENIIKMKFPVPDKAEPLLDTFNFKKMQSVMWEDMS